MDKGIRLFKGANERLTSDMSGHPTWPILDQMVGWGKIKEQKRKREGNREF